MGFADPQYFASYASASDHCTIIISKEVATSKSKKTIVIASFGLYGEKDNYLASIATLGNISENGKIRSDHFLLESAKKESRKGRRRARYFIAAKSYPITNEQAIEILEEVKKDSEIGQLKKETNKRKMAIDESLMADFTPKEKELHLWFKQELNKNKRGGPLYNGRDYNCKAYALYILRKLGIRDASLESGRYPDKFEGRLQPAFFDIGMIWSSSLNKQPLRQDSILFPRQYYKIFNAYIDEVDGISIIL